MQPRKKMSILPVSMKFNKFYDYKKYYEIFNYRQNYINYSSDLYHSLNWNTDSAMAHIPI